MTPVEVVVVAAGRSAIGKAGKGSLVAMSPVDLAAQALRGVVERARGLAPEAIDDVILGCATPEAEQGLDIARLAALRAGLPDRVGGLTVNRFCASGLEALALAAAKIATGQAQTVLAGGVESLSRVPFQGETLRLHPGLAASRPEIYQAMGPLVEGLARRYGISRADADAFAAESQRKAADAQAAGRFEDEIFPVSLPDGGIFARDEGIRPDTTIERLAALKPAFAEDGILTAGNSSQLSDGAAAALLTSAERAAAAGLAPLARLVGYATAAVAPQDFGIAPALAIPSLLERTGIALDAIELIEFNEAFAAQVLASQKVFPLPLERVNVNGGAVALGHPLGATGARQTATLLYEARRRGARYGLVAMCAALGMGAAALFEFSK